MQELCHHKLVYISPLKLCPHTSGYSTAIPRRLTLKLQATSAHASTDTAERQQVRSVKSVYQPLTKARKKQQSSSMADNSWLKAKQVVAYAALAAAAGAALTALHVDAVNAAASGAALAIGAAVLPPLGSDVDAGTQHVRKGGVQFVFGVVALGRNAFGHVLQAANNKPSSSTARYRSSETGVLQSVDLDEPSQTGSGLLSIWEDERDKAYFDPDEMTDAQWALCSKVIETSSYPLSLEDARQFAKQFQASIMLPGQTMESQQGQVLSLDTSLTNAPDNKPQSPSRKLNSIVKQAQKREKHKQKKKARKRRHKRN